MVSSPRSKTAVLTATCTLPPRATMASATNHIRSPNGHRTRLCCTIQASHHDLRVRRTTTLMALTRPCGYSRIGVDSASLVSAYSAVSLLRGLDFTGHDHLICVANCFLLVYGLACLESQDDAISNFDIEKLGVTGLGAALVLEGVIRTA